MLSQQERRQLSQIEEHLEASDPRLAAMLAGMRTRPRWRRAAWLSLMWVAVAAGMLAGWWVVALLLIGPLLALTLGAIGDRMMGWPPTSEPMPGNHLERNWIAGHWG